MLLESLIRIAYHAIEMIDDPIAQMKETERIWQEYSSRKFPGDIQNRALRKLRQLDAAAMVEDPRNPPGNRLEVLKGDRAEQTMAHLLPMVQRRHRRCRNRRLSLVSAAKKRGCKDGAAS
jgi:plasmid maintenance system killer protein